MRYIDAIAGSTVAFVIFAALAYYVNGYGVSDDVTIILTVSSFLFAILAGFFISRFNIRYDKVRELLASEDARFLSLYKISFMFGKKFSDRITDLIDKYYIISLDLLSGENAYKPTMVHFLSIYDEINKLKKGRQRDDAALEETIDYLADLENYRNTRAVLVEEKITPGQWMVLIILSIIIIFSVFYMHTATWYSIVVTVLLSTVVILVLLILRDLENLRLGGKLVAIESGEEVLEAMGRPRYYNQRYVDNGSIHIPQDISTYRLGVHRPGEKIKIKVVRR